MPLNELQQQHGPFAYKWELARVGERDYVITCDATDRIRIVRESNDPEWLAAVVREPNTQKTVVAAAQARLRKLANQKPRS